VWVSSSDAGGVSVYMLDGYKPVRISDNTLDSKLSLTGGTDVTITGVKLNGKTLFFLTFSNLTFVYCLEDQTWHEWSAGSGIALWHRFAASSASSQVYYCISFSSTSGKVYKINPVAPVYADDGVSYSSFVQTSKIDLGTENRKFLKRLTVVGDTDPVSHPISVDWTDDDYTTYQSARSLNMNSSRKYFSNGGIFRRRAFRVVDTTTRPLRLEALELDIKESNK
jgi:hypothetical protein